MIQIFYLAKLAMTISLVKMEMTFLMAAMAKTRFQAAKVMIGLLVVVEMTG